MRIKVDSAAHFTLYIDDETYEDEYGNTWEELVTRINSGEATGDDIFDYLDVFISDMPDEYEIEVRDDKHKLIYLGAV